METIMETDSDEVQMKESIPNDSAVEDEQASSTKSAVFQHHAVADKFKVNRAVIETVPDEQQDVDLRNLGLSVYDQETFEKGVLQQVDRALDEQKLKLAKEKLEKELINVSEEINAHEQSIKKNESLAKALLAGGAEVLHRSILIKKDVELKRKQIKALCAKLHSLEKKKIDLLASEVEGNTSENVFSGEDEETDDKHSKTECVAGLLSNDAERSETEMEKKIRLGEMTPFGTVLQNNKSPSNADRTLTNFEKYLETQTKLHLTQRKGNIVKKKGQRVNLKDKASKTKKEVPSKSKPSPLKKSILLPKKRRAKEKLGSSTSEDYQDQLKNPGKLLSEKTAFEESSDDVSDDGSEYVPSEEELREAEESEKRRKKWEGPTLHRMKKRRQQKLISPPEEWKSDDSDWEYSDDESRLKKRKKSKKEIDDGNADDYNERVKLWEKTQTGETERGDQELDGGYRIPKYLWKKLYNYQKVGVQWLWELNQQRCGGILGDEMGLGKTVQVIAFLAGLSYSKLVSRHGGYRGLGPVLIVCPTTVMHQWVREFHTWWPPFRVAVLHESGSFDGRRESLIGIINSNNGILVTSYVGAVQHKDTLTEKNWHYVILDEGHKIRNPDAQVTIAVKMFRTPHRIILSGSPMQNSLKELWSLFDFVFPGKLGTLPVFLAQLAVPITQGGYANASEIQVATAYRCATVLRDTISPYLLRRMKSDVKTHINLPQKTEHVLFCRLTDEQRQYYKAYLDSGEVERILQGHAKVFLGLINLRKICNHPDLYSGGPKLFRGENEDDIPEEQRYGHWKKSGKMIVIESLLKIWKKQGRRVLLFTQSRQMLCLLELFIQKQGYKYMKLDGGTSIAARQPLIAKYNEDTSYFLFLLTTRVGGLGVNLTGANRVVIYDPDWNPATDTQARERAWRIGQQNNVTVYRLITAGTIEEKVYHRQIFKQFLTNKVLQDPRQRRFFKSNDLFELFTLKETDVDGSTETSAIFAGTGSEVKVKLKKEKKIQNGKLQKYNDCVIPKKPEEYHKSTSVVLSDSKLNYMKRLAQQLSKKIGSSTVKNDNQNMSDSINKNDHGKKVKEMPAAEGMLQMHLSEKTSVNSDVASSSSTAMYESAGTSKSFYDNEHCSPGIERKEPEQKNDKHNNFPSICSLDNICQSESQMNYASTSTQKKTNVKPEYYKASDKTKEHVREGSHRKHKHKHKHRKKHLDVFEGEKVPHLVGQDVTKPAVPSDDEDAESQQDDYVLKQLFKKSGLQTALRHDSIMKGGEADYALVEGEAQRVAKEAVKALKESRQQCYNAGHGVPTWTGQHGVIRVPGNQPCLKFSKKKKNITIPSSSTSISAVASTSGLFSGKQKPDSGNMSSSELLARIRARNRLLASTGEPSEEQPIVQSTASSDDPNVELLTDIRNFIAYGASVDGRASTQEIIDRFQDRLPPGSSPLFKFLLQEISEFHRTPSGEGVWKLRGEFKWM